MYLWIKVDTDELGLCVSGQQRLAKVERTGLVHPLQPLFVDLFIPTANQIYK
jgi:hypothetical protein